MHPRDRVAGGMVPRCLVERIEAQLRLLPLPSRRLERLPERGRLVRAQKSVASEAGLG